MKPATNLFSADTAPLSFGVLVLPDSNTLSLGAAIDPLRVANRRHGSTIYRWQILSVASQVTLTSGIAFHAPAFTDTPDYDVLLVVAGFRLEDHATPDLLRRLRHVAPRLRGIGGIDGGSWLLARAGLLDGQTATTHWEDLESFATRFPAINVVQDRFAISGRVFTTGGAAPCLDLMLHLIGGRQGADLAMRVAGTFIYDPVHAGSAPQSLVSAARLRQTAPAVARAIDMMERTIEEPPAIAAIARAVGLSARRLETLFQTALGTSPGAFRLTLRLQEARRLAMDTALPVQQIALRTGFSSQAALARAVKSRFGASLSDLRRTQRP
jgi:transcriptional regulator GlxA family with amidase domain